VSTRLEIEWKCTFSGKYVFYKICHFSGFTNRKYSVVRLCGSYGERWGPLFGSPKSRVCPPRVYVTYFINSNKHSKQWELT
jgi:hypothetical protein